MAGDVTGQADEMRVAFVSDNVAPVAPEIMQAIAAANAGDAPPYGLDAITRSLDGIYGALFETPVRVLPVATGTAGNALALASLVAGDGVIYCHEEAHIQISEYGASALFTGGARLELLPGAGGRIDPVGLSRRLAEAPPAARAALSLTQANEAGTVYSAEEIGALTDIARRHGLAVHMDGARFANAVAALGCAPADVTWRAGVEVLSFGTTKNGTVNGDAIIYLRPELAPDMRPVWQRAGQHASKMRYAAAQLARIAEDGLWLRLAAQANGMADRLGAGLAAIPGARLRHPVETNQVFVELPDAVEAALAAAGYGVRRWQGGRAARFVTSFANTVEEVDAFLAAAGRDAG